MSQFYDENATLTFQIAPYLCSSKLTDSSGNKSKLKSPHLWKRYEHLACNLLPGSVPLPAWAWTSLSQLVSSLPKSQKPVVSLGKSERKQLKALQAFQTGHTQRLLSVSRNASSRDRDTPGIPQPPISRHEARGRTSILGLLGRLPPLIHIKNNDCAHMDVVTVEVCFYIVNTF